jgi:hypothetical protein
MLSTSADKVGLEMFGQILEDSPGTVDALSGVQSESGAT